MAGPSHVRGMRDITIPFLEACQHLRPSEIVKPSNLQMLEAMNSLTLLDARMDSGVSASPDEGVDGVVGVGNGKGKAKERFDPNRRLSAEEVCAIMDRLLACEMTYHEGGPLVNSVFTSRHMLNISLLTSTPNDVNITSDPTRPPELTHLVFRSYLLMYNLTLHLIWHELARGNGNVYDGEDFMSDTAGLWGDGQEWPVVDGSVEAGEEAEEWLRSSEEGMWRQVLGRVIVNAYTTYFRLTVSQEWKDHLLSRLAFRKALLLYTIDDLSGRHSPVDPPLDLHTSLSTLSSLPPISDTVVTSPLVRAAFDDRVARRLRQAIPVPSLKIQDHTEALTSAKAMAEGLEICSWLGRTADLKAWNDCLHHMALSESPPTPFIRSLLMTTFNPSPHEVILHSSLPSAWVADKWLHDRFGMSPGYLRALGWELDATDQRAGRGIRLFADQLAGNLISDFHILCQNRSRQRRFLLASCFRWEEIWLSVHPAAVIGEQVHRQLTSGIAAHRLELMLDGMLANLDLGLIAPDEWARIWWWLSIVTRERQSHELSPWETSWWMAWSRVAEGMCMALAHLSPSPSSPPNIPVDIARFDVRFKWAQKVPSHPTRAAHFTRPRYQEWKDSEERLSRIKAEVCLKVASNLFKSAAGYFSSCWAIAERAELPEVIVKRKMDMMAHLRYTCRSNSEAMFACSLASEKSKHTWRWEEVNVDGQGRYVGWIPRLSIT